MGQWGEELGVRVVEGTAVSTTEGENRDGMGVGAEEKDIEEEEEEAEEEAEEVERKDGESGEFIDGEGGGGGTDDFVETVDFFTVGEGGRGAVDVCETSVCETSEGDSSEKHSLSMFGLKRRVK